MTGLKELIWETILQAGIKEPPVDMEKILRFLDLDDLFFDSEIIPEEGTALFFDQLKGKWRIRIPGFLNRKRLTFDLAHECVEYLALKSELNCSHREINEGAAELLIPGQWGKDLIEKEGLDLFALKRKFYTASIDTCALRLLNLSPYWGVLVVVQGKGRMVKFKRRRKWLSPDEEAFIAEASLSPHPLERSHEGQFFKSFPIWDEKKLRVKKSYIFLWEKN